MSRFASAPVNWGVWERTIDRDDLVPVDEVLGAMVSLGYRATELGPPGYLGADADSVRAALAPFGLVLVGGFVELHLADEAAFERDLPQLDRTLAILASAGTGAVALLADAGTPERFAAAGRPEELARTRLAGGELDRAVSMLARAVERCHERGVEPAIHAETGTYLEAPAEVEAFLSRIDRASVCLETGHLTNGGGDPAELAVAWRDRISHVHLKDVDGTLLARIRRGELSVLDAWEEGLFCPFGEGVVDLAGVVRALSGFEGWVLLEQDRIAVRREDVPAVNAVEARNLEYIRRLVDAVP